MYQWADAIMEKILAKYAATVPEAGRRGVIPYRGGKGEWIGSPYEGNSWWTGGFWPGLLWLLYAESGESVFSDEARRAQALLREELLAHHGLSHDVGFMYFLSFGAESRIAGNRQAPQILLQAADLLAGRYNPAGFIRAWNGNGRAGWVSIDSMMNLPLLYWAAGHTGDPRYAKIASSHADTSIRHFVRSDGSCNHIVIFDADTGEALEAPGGQGYGPGSSWSRGQAWGLYGFLLTYLGSGEIRYLETARRIADYFVKHIRPDGLTDCDFRQPKDIERIDNIAGACAASGLLLMAETVGIEEGGYREAAIRMIQALHELCADYGQENFGVLQKCTAAYHDDGAGRHINTVYGDFFFAEAIARLRGSDPFLWDARIEDNGWTLKK
jgi:unsaturated chondroitin disaccharide hydrolase